MSVEESELKKNVAELRRIAQKHNFELPEEETVFVFSTGTPLLWQSLGKGFFINRSIMRSSESPGDLYKLEVSRQGLLLRGKGLLLRGTGPVYEIPVGTPIIKAWKSFTAGEWVPIEVGESK